MYRLVSPPILHQNRANFQFQAREGPVQFEKSQGADPFGVDDLISEVEKKTSAKRYGLEKDDDRAPKRARMDDDDIA